MFPGILLFAIWYSINYKFINEPQILLFYHSVRYKNILNVAHNISNNGSDSETGGCLVAVPGG